MGSLCLIYTDIYGIVTTSQSRTYIVEYKLTLKSASEVFSSDPIGPVRFFELYSLRIFELVQDK